MSRLTNLLLLAVALGAAPAWADEDETDTANVAASGKNLYLGAGLFSDMLNVNVETVTRWGNFMLRVGQFQRNEGVAGNLSWRVHLDEDDGHLSGYYVGFFGGQVTGENLLGDSYQRLGAGAEMGYHWVKEYSRTELTVGLGASEPLEVGYIKLQAEPQIFFSVNVALGY